MESKDEIFDLREFYEIIKKRIILIISLTLIAFLAGFVVNSYILKPVYQAKSEILVYKDTGKDSTTPQEIQTSINLINTYNLLIKSPLVLEKVGESLNLSDGETAGLGGKISVGSVKNSQVISITVQDSSPKRAALIANTLATTFQSEIKNVMDLSNVKVISKAKENAKAAPVKPKKSINIAIATIVGFFLSIGLALFIEYLDNTLKTEKDIEKVLALPILGAVPEINTEEKKKRHRLYFRPFERVARTRERRA